MKQFIILFYIFSFFNSFAQKELASCCSGKCTGETPCLACKTCSGCKFCSKEGGTCGSCSAKKGKTKTIETKEEVDFAQNFKGKVRAKAKTSISKGKVLTYQTVGNFLAALPTDGYMRSQNISNNSPRTRDEDFNIFIKEAYIFYMKKEEDNDIHVIIGDIKNNQKVNLLTVEISGLPNALNPDYQTLFDVRKSFYEKFSSFLKGEQQSIRTKKPYPKISIQGSLFFDNWHYAEFEENNSKPNTVFEIHPITHVTFW